MIFTLRVDFDQRGIVLCRTQILKWSSWLTEHMSASTVLQGLNRTLNSKPI
jgi:hypothetical protein